MLLSRYSLYNIRIILNIQKMWPSFVQPFYFSNCTIGTMDSFTKDLLQRQRTRTRSFNVVVNDITWFMEFENSGNVSETSNEELNNMFLELLSKGRDKQIAQLVYNCCCIRKFIYITTLKKLFANYSNTGKPELIVILQNYCAQVDPNLYKQNGHFLHYLAKAQCLKGNSEKGLLILRDSYSKFENLRGLCRIIFRELIQDSVMNRSEASLVIFKKYVLQFSEELDDDYPLICFWHICWSSTWFSDQMVSDELLEASESLRNIVKDKATAFAISALRQEYNEDAVFRLLQTLLKYHMKEEYVKVLQILFNYKLRNRDIQGCTEIIRNCEVLGVCLPSSQQGRYIQMLIHDKQPASKQSKVKPETKNFKLKF